MPSKFRKTQKDKRRKHSQERAQKHYGIELKEHDVNCIVNKIKNGKAQHIFTESCSKTHFLVPFGGTLLRVVYSKASKITVTILPFTVDEGVNVASMDSESIDEINKRIKFDDGKKVIHMKQVSHFHSVFVVKRGKRWIKVHYHEKNKTIFDPE
jgi:hypothetical protein